MNGKFCWKILLLLFFTIVSTAWGQCVNGNEKGCVWSHDKIQPAQWVEKKDSSTQWLEVTQCIPECGKAVLVSPWLPPRDQEASWMFRYKLYGFKSVTLGLSMKTEDSGPTKLFFEKGDYSNEFPEYWKGTKVVIPPVNQKHRLLLEAVTPFKDAFVAVADVTTKAEVTVKPLPSETIPKTTPVEAESPTSEEVVELEARTVEPTSQIKEVAFSSETQTESNKVEKKTEKDRYGALEAGFGGDPDLWRGYTVIMDPNICMYP